MASRRNLVATDLPESSMSVRSPWIWRGYLFMALIALGPCLTFASAGQLFESSPSSSSRDSQQSLILGGSHQSGPAIQHLCDRLMVRSACGCDSRGHHQFCAVPGPMQPEAVDQAVGERLADLVADTDAGCVDVDTGHLESGDAVAPCAE
jgi:hypothetical protein